RAEWSDDDGTAAAGRHRANIERGLRRARAALDAFAPDVVVIWGDDQYENFREDIIPPFCVLAYGDQDVQPWKHVPAPVAGRPNAWGEDLETTRTVRGAPEVGKQLVSALIENDFDIAYAYRPLHHDALPHAFLNAVLYLDLDRTGFPYPVVPFQVNCYGRKVISHRGSLSRFADASKLPDPPSPTPRRCFDVGRSVARWAAASDLKVALCASSSWSHAFLVDKNWRLYPDIARDRALYEALVAGDLASWREVPLSSVEESGQQELLNWFCLAGAMHELGTELAWSEFVETHVFNSNKVTAIYAPHRVGAAIAAR
ncbi:MAG: hypothetical protein QOJ39_3856, partial [Candidatus Eremiobacteraeota bacterium]|nr:hypothetical protein [Candidatus Eremiobacteraeota bacterium]